MRKHGRVDANQADIVKALRQVGASVQSLADIGKGCADILVGFHGRNWLMEIKMPGCHLTPDEKEWHAGWQGAVVVVRSVEEALGYLFTGED